LRDAPLAWIGPCFVVAQVCLCYFVSGVAKLRTPEWVHGHALGLVLDTRVYGWPAVAALTRGDLGLAGCWTIVLWESTFPLALLAPPLTAAYLAFVFCSTSARPS
jgi:hypothetical protein